MLGAGGSIQSFVNGKGQRLRGWLSERQPLHGPMDLLAVPVPCRAVTVRLHSPLHFTFWEGEVT
jgi:hypothetical protein